MTVPGDMDRRRPRTMPRAGPVTAGAHPVEGTDVDFNRHARGFGEDAVGETRQQIAACVPRRVSAAPHSGQGRFVVRERDDGAVSLSGHAAAVGRRALIIELFGPAAAGKTTLTRALGEALDARGIAVRIVSSARPAERARPHGRDLPHTRSPLTAPLARASKLFSALGTLIPGATVDPVVRQLMQALPSGSWIRTLRLRRYLAHLCRSWNAARASDGVVIFDQGFVNLLGSLALFAGPIDRCALARGLALFPEPDLLVRLDTPRAVLEARLEKRLRRQSAIERLFENNVGVCPRQIELTSTLDSLLAESGRHVTRVRWVDRAELATAVDAITTEILARRGGGATRPPVSIAGSGT